MAAIAPQLARRLDRLARRAHRFHRFAHHPLCAPYAGEVLRAGRRLRLCRGCTHAAAGTVAGALLGAALPLPSTTALMSMAAIAVLAASWAVRRPRSPARPGKLVTRAAPVTLAATIVLLGARSGTSSGAIVALATLCCVLLAAVRYRRRGPDRSPCRTCPEYGSPNTCSGFRPLVRREAAHGRIAGKLLRTVTPPSTRVTAPAWPGTKTPS